MVNGKNSAKLCQSLISKIHIRIPNEPKWHENMPQIQRKSNHYLVLLSTLAFTPK